LEGWNVGTLKRWNVGRLGNRIGLIRRIGQNRGTNGEGGGIETCSMRGFVRNKWNKWESGVFERDFDEGKRAIWRNECVEGELNRLIDGRREERMGHTGERGQGRRERG
jgi:hypothetical protein